MRSDLLADLSPTLSVSDMVPAIADPLWPLITWFFGNGTLLMLGLITLLGTAVGHFLGGPDRWDRTVLGLSTSARHPAVAIAAATSAVAEGGVALAAVVLYVLVVAAAYGLSRKRQLMLTH